jgi:hypothetical protein
VSPQRLDKTRLIEVINFSGATLGFEGGNAILDRHLMQGRIMTEKMTRLTIFSTGEVDITTWKRTDVNEYLSAAQSLLNMEVGTTGLTKKRPGTSVLLNASPYAKFNSRMYDFVDQFGIHYLLMSSSGFFYVFGAPTEETQVITNTGADVVTGYGTNVVINSNNLLFVQAIPTPYLSGDLAAIDYTQDNDVFILSHPSYPPARIYISQYNGSSPPTFAYMPLNIYPLPSYDFNTINYNNFTVALSVTNNILTFQFTGLGSDPGFTSAWIGGEIIGGGATDIDPVGYAIITNVSYSGGTTTFTATVQIPFQTSGYATIGSQYSVRQPVWSAALGYPAKTVFYQSRLWFANTPQLSNGIFGSKVNNPVNFDVGTGRDTDAIVYIIGQTNSGAILWMNGGKQLEVYCQNLEFACPQNENVALTPTTFAIRQQSAYGSSPLLKPLTYINDSYYATKTGKAFVNFHFNGIGLTYTSSNISAASSHLVKNPSNRALLRGSDTSQDNFIYYLNPDDDTITAFQFAAEYKLAALTPITFNQGIQLIDIATIDNSIYILKYYPLTDQFTVEQFDDSIRVDAAFDAAMQSSGLVTGLSLLNGYTVQVVYKNQDFGQYLVVNGQITVTNPQSIADTVLIGILYSNNVIPMYPFSGAAESPFKKKVSRIYVDYYNSLNFSVNGNLVPYQNYKDIQAGLPLMPQTSTAIITPISGWNRFDNNGTPIISITQSSPFDLQILGIGYQIESEVI